MKQLPQEFCERMKSRLGGDYPAFIDSLELSPLRALRVNTHKLSAERFCELSPWKLERVPWMDEGFVIAAETQELGTHPYHLAGLFYVQEPSAMAPAAALGVKEGMLALDLCASPGGKATAIAARLGESGVLVANEIVPNRARTLLQNVQRMGLGNTIVTNMPPEALCEQLCGCFDAVLVDAPCSGEGMFRKDDTAIEEWSVEHVRACAQRQSGILESAAKALRPGGRMVYSTCTFSSEENEETIEAFLKRHGDFVLIEEKHLYPHECAGEGQYYALMQRTGDGRDKSVFAPERSRPDKGTGKAREALRALFPNMDTDRMRLLPDGRLILPPALMPQGKLHILMAGTELGELRKDRFEPAHALFQSRGGECAVRLSFSTDDARLSAYLRGETVPAQGLSGYTAVCVDGFPLGFGKVVDGVMKNHFPKGLRRKR